MTVRMKPLSNNEIHICAFPHFLVPKLMHIKTKLYICLIIGVMFNLTN